MYDAVIVGGSFAGLAAAMQLRGFKVLVIDQRPIGTHQSSTCATPLPVAQAVGATNAIQQTHNYLVTHVAHRDLRYHLQDPYVTFDYHTFCRAMLAQTGAEVWLARAMGYQDGLVTTTRGEVSARCIVDASGWQSLKRHVPERDRRPVGYGMETELPVTLPLSPGLHFYFEKKIVRNGYAWVFPCGSSSRIGVCSFDQGVHLRSMLDAFLDRFGLQCGSTHGGGIPILRRQPLSSDLFVIGDAGGQCLPIWAEGIRSAIYHGTACGQAIAGVLAGDLSLEEARIRYATLARRTERFQLLLLAVHNTTAWLPEWWRALILATISRVRLADPFVKVYQRGSGWLSSTSPPILS